MELIIKNNMSYLVGDGYYPYGDIKVFVNVPKLDFSKQTLIVKVNDLPSRSVTREFWIPLAELLKPKLDVKVSVKTKETGNLVEYPMDPINLRKAFLFGDNIEEQYPAAFKKMMLQIAEVKQQVLVIMKAIQELEERGEIL